MKAMLDPRKDLKGATLETLAKALLRPLIRPSAAHGAKPVVGDKVRIKEVTPDKARDRGVHLGKRS